MSGAHPIRSVTVAGGGIVGLSAANAFAAALPQAIVGVIETPRDPAALTDRLPACTPGIHRFHAAIGVDERDLLRDGIATHHLGSLMRGWPGEGAAWAHAFGAHGKPVGPIAFDQIWARAQRSGQALDYGAYSLAAALARAGRFAHPPRDAAPSLPSFSYGLRVDPDRYRERLADLARQRRVSFRAGAIAGLERREDGGIAALLLDGGERAEADLFVDCTGPAAQLIAALDDSFEDWSAWLPFGRLGLSEAPGPKVPATAATATADSAIARDDGWTAEYALAGRIITAAVHDQPGDDSVAISRGRRVRPWVRNVLALGESATAFDPLHGLGLDAAHAALLLALELLPGRDFNPLETGEYNRRADQLTLRRRDFAALHFRCSPGRGGAWRSCAAQAPPDSLARTLDHYDYRGRLPFHEEESITRDSWSAALIGLGLLPRNVDPQAAQVPLDQATAAMARLAQDIGTAVATLPPYAEYLARIVG